MNKNLLLIGVLALLILVAYLLLQRPGEQSRSESGGTLLAVVDSVLTDKIEIHSPLIHVTLEKQGAEWFLQSPIAARADQQAVATFLHQLKDLDVKATISTNPQKHSVFQVDSTGTVVKIFQQGTEKGAFIVGKTGSDFTSVYARASGSDEVVLVDAAVSSGVTHAVKDWRDRAIINAPRENIREVRFQYGDTTFAVAWKDSAWMIGRDSAQESAVNSLITSLASLQADDFLDTPPSPAPKIAAIISFNGIQIRFASLKGSDKYSVQTSLSPQWFELQSWRANQVLKRKKDLARPTK